MMCYFESHMPLSLWNDGLPGVLFVPEFIRHHLNCHDGLFHHTLQLRVSLSQAQIVPILMQGKSDMFEELSVHKVCHLSVEDLWLKQVGTKVYCFNISRVWIHEESQELFHMHSHLLAIAILGNHPRLRVILYKFGEFALKELQ